MLRITEELAASYAEANNIYKNFPEAISLPTSAGRWVWVAPQYPQVADEYRSGVLTGLEPAPAGVILRVLPPPPSPPAPSRTPVPTVSLPNIPDTSTPIDDNGGGIDFGDNTDAVFDNTTYNIGSGGRIDSPYNSEILYNYIVQEIRAELLAEFGQDAYYDKNLDRISRALARAIKKYLIIDVKAKPIGLITNETELSVVTSTGGGYVVPNPHNHTINPHGHDILAP